MLGTPQYISPEQAQGVMDLDQGTDVYSLGIVLYEMVVGKVPFNADTPFSIIHDHIYTPLPLPTEMNPFVDSKVERVLLKALAKDRADRFKNVIDLVEAYRSAMLDIQEDLEAIPVAEWGAMQQQGEIETQAPVISPVDAKPLIEEPKQQAEAKVEDVEHPERNTSTRRNWIWVAAGLALTTLCLFAFLVVFSQNAESAEVPMGYKKIGFALMAFIPFTRFQTVDRLHPPGLGR
jgi:serine/threonine protein kinase